MGTRGEDGRDHRRGVGSGLFRPADESLGCPLRIGLMGARHVFGQGRMTTELIGAHMRGDANTPMKQFDGVGREGHLQGLFDQLIRDRIVVSGHLHVIIDMDLGLAPLRVGIAFCGKGAHRRAVERFEQLTPATWQLFEGMAVELLQ